MYTEKINKVALSNNDDKRFDKITTYPHGTYAFKVCESEMMIVRDFFCWKLCRLSVLWWNNIATEIIRNKNKCLKKLVDFQRINDKFW